MVVVQRMVVVINGRFGTTVGRWIVVVVEVVTVVVVGVEFYDSTYTY